MAGLGGIATTIGDGATRVLPASPRTDGPGVPSTIYAVPERLLRFPESDARELVWTPDLQARRNLAVGRAAAVLAVGANSGQLPMVVTADDGRYVPLRPPGYSDAASINNGTGETSAVALSEDGTLMAYAWWDPDARLDRPMPAGVRIVELASGDVTEVALEGGDGVDVDTLAFSPDGHYLVWTGTETRSWTPTSRRGSAQAAGRIEVGSAESTPVALPGGVVHEAAVSDSGTVALRAGSTVVLDDAGERARFSVPGSRGGRLPAPRFSADGSRLAFNGPGGTLAVLDVTTGAVTRHEDRIVAPMGWTADGDVAVTVGPSPNWRTLQVVDPGDPERVEVVAVMIPSDVDHVELATGLMTRARPTVERPEPDWPWTSALRRVVTTAAVTALVIGAVLAVGVLLVWRRRRTT